MKSYPNKSFPEAKASRLCAWPSLEDIKRKFEGLEKQAGGLFQYLEIGRSVENRSILCARVTNPRVSDSDKQAIIFVAAEHGDEKSATGTVLRTIDWLLSPEGEETVNKQIIYLIPVVNVDGYVHETLLNVNGVNLFADYAYDGSLPSQPESRSVWQLLEKIMPDAFFSLHGLSEDWDSLKYPRTWESTNVANTSQYERCYNRRFIDRVNSAAENAGYMQDRGEEDMERILPRIPSFEYHSFPSYEHYGCPVSYCYNRFHSLSSVMEIGPIISGFLRCREILRIGNETWEYECYPGYPNRIIARSCVINTLVAGGSSPLERRKSRVSLWNASKNIGMALSMRDSKINCTYVTRHPEDYHEDGNSFLSDAKNMGAALKLLESKGIKVDKTLDLIGDTWKFPVCVWYDTKAVNRFAERKEGKNFKRHDADKTADVDLPMPAAIRMRLDAEVFPVIVLLNDNEVSREQYREWRDSRYKYLEVDLDNNWTRAVLVVKTTVRA